MKNVKYLAVLVLLVGVIGGCKDKKNTDTATNCQLKNEEWYLAKTNDTNVITYEYDSDGKLLKQSYYTDGMFELSHIYNYSIEEIIDLKEFSANSKQLYHHIYKLDSNGYVISVKNGIYPYNTLQLLEYNVDGNLIKVIDKTSGVINTHTIINGNDIQEIKKDSSGKIISTTTYEYTKNVNKMDVGVDFFGKRDAKFVSKMTEVDSTTKITTYSYTFNKEGYPLEVIQITNYGNSIDTIKTNYTYTCP